MQHQTTPYLVHTQYDAAILIKIINNLKLHPLWSVLKSDREIQGNVAY